MTCRSNIFLCIGLDKIYLGNQFHLFLFCLKRSYWNTLKVHQCPTLYLYQTAQGARNSSINLSGIERAEATLGTPGGFWEVDTT